MTHRVSGAFAVTCAFVGSLGLAVPAHAETAVVLPEGGDPQLSGARRRAVDAVTDILIAEHQRVLSANTVARRLHGSELARCARTDCADDVARALHADIAVAVAIWPAPGTDLPATVAVTLVTNKGQVFPGQSDVRHANVAHGARAALGTARDRQRMGSGPWLSVYGRPDGAQVLLDGSPVGVLPYRGSVEPGHHELTVRLSGFEPETRALDVPLSHHEELVESVHLSSRPRQRMSAWNYVLGGALAVAAVALGVSPLYTLANDGDCSTRNSVDVCTRRIDFGPRSLTLAAAAAASLGASVFILAARPISVHVSARETHVHAQLRFPYR